MIEDAEMFTFRSCTTLRQTKMYLCYLLFCMVTLMFTLIRNSVLTNDVYEKKINVIYINLKNAPAKCTVVYYFIDKIEFKC